MCFSSSMVWYASYGSNLLYKDGFLCYIVGGIRKGASQSESGCADKTPPRKNKNIDIPFPLYFAEKASRWNNGGVAFIGLSKKDNDFTAGRMYLITKGQFRDVVKQENSNKDISIDFDGVIKKGSNVFRKSWYGNIIYLGENDGYPVFTFTHYKDVTDQQLTKPSSEYIQIIAAGLKEAHNWTEDQIAEYLLKKPGIEGNYDRNDLKELCNNAIETDAE
ncbi:MAG: hypothetical protein M0Z79_08185 [Nitrospiraceae bacterium]|nr:hypothetical protein [Nitrospiraceae bacterium]